MALKEGLSDMDYLRSKVVKKTDMVDGEEQENEEVAEEEVEEERRGDRVQQMDSAYESEDKDIQKAATSSQNKVCVTLCNMSEHFYFVSYVLIFILFFHHSFNLPQSSQSSCEVCRLPLKR